MRRDGVPADADHGAGGRARRRAGGGAARADRPACHRRPPRRARSSPRRGSAHIPWPPPRPRRRPARAPARRGPGVGDDAGARARRRARADRRADAAGASSPRAATRTRPPTRRAARSTAARRPSPTSSTRCGRCGTATPVSPARLSPATTSSSRSSSTATTSPTRRRASSGARRRAGSRSSRMRSRPPGWATAPSGSARRVEVRDGVARREDGVLAGSALTLIEAVQGPPRARRAARGCGRVRDGRAARIVRRPSLGTLRPGPMQTWSCSTTSWRSGRSSSAARTWWRRSGVAEILIERVTKEFSGGVIARRRRDAPRRGRRVHGARRPVRLRQVDAAATDRRARGGHGGRALDRRRAMSPTSRRASATSRWSSRTTRSTRT